MIKYWPTIKELKVLHKVLIYVRDQDYGGVCGFDDDEIGTIMRITKKLEDYFKKGR